MNQQMSGRRHLAAAIAVGIAGFDRWTSANMSNFHRFMDESVACCCCIFGLLEGDFGLTGIAIESPSRRSLREMPKTASDLSNCHSSL